MTIRSCAVDFGNTSRGYNSASPSVSLVDGELEIAQNAILLGRGFTRAPGFLGIKSTAVFPAAVCKGIANLHLYTGSDVLAGVAGGQVMSINPANGTTTDLFTTGGSGAAYFDQHANKLWGTDGGTPFKIESAAAAYRIGIAAPVGVTASAVSGGSLADGVYGIYVSYARKVSGSNVLFSQGQLVAAVTISGSNKTVRLSFPNSADAQVNNKVVWMTDADGALHYFYAETSDNTTTTVNVTSASARNEFVTYLIEAADNGLPSTSIRSIHAFDNRLWANVNNVVYYSMKGAAISGRPAYDVERWPINNYIELPFRVVDGGIFSLGSDIYFSTEGGLIALAYGDPSQPIQFLDRRLYFKYGRTIRIERGRIWGVTNDGVRYFAPGAGFSQDMSKKIKPDIDDLYIGAAAGHEPAAELHRRSGQRTEYHLSYRNPGKSVLVPTTTLVLDIDASGEISSTDLIAPWEKWDGGFQSSAVTPAGAFYRAQSSVTAGTIYQEHGCCDQYIFDLAGALLSAETPKELFIRTRTTIPDLKGIEDWQTLYVLGLNSADIQFKVYGADIFSANTSRKIASTAATPAVFDAVVFDAVVFVSETPAVRKLKMNMKTKGRSVYVEVTQTAKDESLNIIDMSLTGQIETESRL